MEKKTKKLQLRKETIAVLNGERMSHVVGGGDGCRDTMVYMFIEQVHGYGCQCKNGYLPNGNGECERPEDIITLWPTDICPYSMRYTCVQVCNSLENTCNSCGPMTECNCA